MRMQEKCENIETLQPLSTSNTQQRSRLDCEIIRKHRKWSLLKGKEIELLIEFTDSATGKVKSRGKICYRVRKKEFAFTVANNTAFYSNINSCLKYYKEAMEKIYYA